jgi:hypothetical protein
MSDDSCGVERYAYGTDPEYQDTDKPIRVDDLQRGITIGWYADEDTARSQIRAMLLEDSIPEPPPVFVKLLRGGPCDGCNQDCRTCVCNHF